MIQVEKDIKAAKDMINGYAVNLKQYRPVNLFTDTSLKFFKNYKLNEKNVLTKCNSISEVFDLISYGANVTVYSTNRFDEYFLYLSLALLDTKYNTYISYFFKNYGKVGATFSNSIYYLVRDNLDEKIRYFFDEVFKHTSGINLERSNIIKDNKYDYRVLCMYIRYLLEAKYLKMKEITKDRDIKFLNCQVNQIQSFTNKDKFDLVNLSYSTNVMTDEDIKEREKNILKFFLELLSEKGKIQGFVGRKISSDILNWKEIETKSIDSAYKSKNDSEKTYGYVYYE